MHKVTVVPEDSVIVIDGVAVSIQAQGMPTLDANWHALQYDADAHMLRIEAKQGSIDPLTGAEADNAIAPFIAAFNSAAPPDTPAPGPLRKLTPREFRLRLTDGEQAAITAAALADAQVFDWRLRAAEAQEIDLDLAETSLGIDFLISKGLLAVGRKPEILA